LRAREEGIHEKPRRLSVRNLDSTNSHKRHLQERVSDNAELRCLNAFTKAARTPPVAPFVTATAA
jgi:hypothetical protein